MSLATLLPIGGAALGLLASRTVAGFAEGLSFKSLLAKNEAVAPDTSNPPAEVSNAVNLAEVLPKFIVEMRNRLEGAGVDLSHPCMLKDDGQGRIIVDGEHPDRSLIEQTLSQDPTLVSEFQTIAAAASEQRQRYPMAMDNAFGEFRLRIADGIGAIRFE